MQFFVTPLSNRHFLNRGDIFIKVFLYTVPCTLLDVNTFYLYATIEYWNENVFANIILEKSIVRLLVKYYFCIENFKKAYLAINTPVRKTHLACMKAYSTC